MIHGCILLGEIPQSWTDLPWNFFLPSSVLTHECKRNRSFRICHFRPCMSSKALKGMVELPVYCLIQKKRFHCGVFQATIFCFHLSLTQIHEVIEF